MGARPRRIHDGVMSEHTVLDQITDRSTATGIVRWHDGRMFGGVARGIAARYDLDPVVVRVAFVVAAFLGSVGIAAYLLAWALLPDDRGRLPLAEAVRQHTPSSIALVVVAALAVLGFVLGIGENKGGRLLGVAALAGVGYVYWRYGVRRPRPDAGPSSRMVPSGESTPAEQVPAAPTRAAAAAPTGQAGTGATQMPVITPWGGRDGERWSASRPAGAPSALHPIPAPVVAKPPPPRRRSLGWRLWALALGLAVLSYGVARQIALARGVADVSASTLAAGAAVAVVGLAVVVVGARGYRTSGVASTAVIAALLTLATPWATGNVGPDAANGAVRWQPAAAAELDRPYEIGAGEGELDLTRLSAAELGGKTVHASVGLGELKVRVPADVRVEVRHDVGLGEVRVQDGAGLRTLGEGAGIAGTDTVGDGPTLTLDLEVGLGEAQIERVAR